jgi:hypothetical protein
MPYEGTPGLCGSALNRTRRGSLRLKHTQAVQAGHRRAPGSPSGPSLIGLNGRSNACDVSAVCWFARRRSGGDRATSCRDSKGSAPIRWLMTDNGAVGLTAPWHAAAPSRSAIAAGPEHVEAGCPVAAESAESPHCIALQVATVRYSVEEKLAVTCDNAQNRWSGRGRYLLCKQKAVGSSPTVSTMRKRWSEAISAYQMMTCPTNSSPHWVRMRLTTCRSAEGSRSPTRAAKQRTIAGNTPSWTPPVLGSWVGQRSRLDRS